MFMGWFTASLGSFFFFFFFFFFFSYMDTFTFFLGPQMHCLSIHSELCPMF